MLWRDHLPLLTFKYGDEILCCYHSNQTSVKLLLTLNFTYAKLSTYSDSWFLGFFLRKENWFLLWPIGPLLGVKAKHSNQNGFPALSNQFCSPIKNKIFFSEIKCRYVEFWRLRHIRQESMTSSLSSCLGQFVMFCLSVHSSHRHTYHVHSAKTPFTTLVPSRQLIWYF